MINNFFFRLLAFIGGVFLFGFLLNNEWQARNVSYAKKISRIEYELDEQIIQTEANRLFRLRGYFPSRELLFSKLLEFSDSSVLIDPFNNKKTYSYQEISRNDVVLGYRIVSAGVDKSVDLNNRYYSDAELKSYSMFREFFGTKDILIAEIYFDTFFNKDAARKLSEIDIDHGFIRPYLNMPYEINSFISEGLDVTESGSKVKVHGKFAHSDLIFELTMFETYDEELVKERIHIDALYGFLVKYDTVQNMLVFHSGTLMNRI